MHQHSWSYASSITQSSWLWSYEHGKSYTRWLHHTTINTRKDYHVSSFMIIRIKHNPTILALRYKHGKSYARWLHHTPIKTRKDYHASTFMIIRIKHNPTILALELSTWKELHKMVTSHTDQNTKRLSSINLLDHTHRAWTNHLGVGVINIEKATQDGYITHRSIHEKTVMHQPSWSYASSIRQPSWRWNQKQGKSYARWLHTQYTCINLQPSTTQHLGVGQHRKSYEMVTSHTDHHASTFMIIRIKPNPTILAVELSTWKELHKMVTSHTDQYTKRLSCINLHDHTHQHKTTILALESKTRDKMVTSHTNQYTKRSSCINFHDHTHQA